MPEQAEGLSLKQGNALFADCVAFAKPFIASGDIDPAYPVLKAIISKLGLSEEAAIWLLVLYAAYYDVGSGLVAYRDVSSSQALKHCPPLFLRSLNIAHERRNLFGGRILRHLETWAALAPLAIYLRSNTCAEFWGKVRLVYGNGRWAAFKLSELFCAVLGWPLKAEAVMLAESEGPRLGLALFEGKGWVGEAGLVRFQEALSGALGAPLSLEQAETVLCDFHGLVKGRYYVGHDIDKMQAQIESAPLTLFDKRLLYGARAATLDNRYLGELQGWYGPSKELKRAYRATGLIKAQLT